MKNCLVRLLLCSSIVCVALTGCGEKKPDVTPTEESTVSSDADIATPVSFGSIEESQEVATSNESVEIEVEEESEVETTDERLMVQAGFGEYFTPEDVEDFSDLWILPENGYGFEMTRGTIPEEYSVLKLEFMGDKLVFTGRTLDDDYIRVCRNGNDYYFGTNINSGRLSKVGYSNGINWYHINTDTNFINPKTIKESIPRIYPEYLTEATYYYDDKDDDGSVYIIYNIEFEDFDNNGIQPCYQVYVNKETKFPLGIYSGLGTILTEIEFHEVDSLEIPIIEGNMEEMGSQEEFEKMVYNAIDSLIVDYE